jgi:hypothetical protein
LITIEFFMSQLPLKWNCDRQPQNWFFTETFSRKVRGVAEITQPTHATADRNEVTWPNSPHAGAAAGLWPPARRSIATTRAFDAAGGARAMPRMPATLMGGTLAANAPAISPRALMEALLR